MIFRLMKRDRVFLLTVLGLTPAMAYLAVGFDLGANFLALQFSMMVVLFTWSRPLVRATPFEMALPVEGRDLFLARVVSFFTAVWVPAVTVFLTVWIRHEKTPTGWAMLQVAPILTLALLLPLAIRLPEAAAPVGLVRVLGVLVAAAGVISWRWFGPTISAEIFGAACLVLLIAVWPVIPSSFQMAPANPERVSAPQRVDESAPRLSNRTSAAIAVFRTAFRGYQDLVFFAVMISQALFGIGPIFCAMFTVSSVLLCRQRTRWLLALPISPRGLLTVTLVASVLPLFSGAAIGLLIGANSSFRPDNSLSAGPKPQGIGDVNVALPFWRYAAHGQVPVIQAPWGETVQPVTFSPLGLTFYNPYTTRPDSSKRLHEWQFERATTAIYGRPVTRTEYANVNRASLSQVINEPRMQILEIAAALMGCLLLVYATELPRWHRVRRQSKPILAMLYGMLATPLVAAFGLEMYYNSKALVSISAALVQGAFLRIAERLPNHLSVALAIMIPTAAMYALLEWQFRQSELTGKFQQPVRRW
jgi:hypothetical protein